MSGSGFIYFSHGWNFKITGNDQVSEKKRCRSDITNDYVL